MAANSSAVFSVQLGDRILAKCTDPSVTHHQRLFVVDARGVLHTPSRDNLYCLSSIVHAPAEYALPMKVDKKPNPPFILQIRVQPPHGLQGRLQVAVQVVPVQPWDRVTVPWCPTQAVRRDGKPVLLKGDVCIARDLTPEKVPAGINPCLEAEVVFHDLEFQDPSNEPIELLFYVKLVTNEQPITLQAVLYMVPTMVIRNREKSEHPDALGKLGLAVPTTKEYEKGDMVVKNQETVQANSDGLCIAYRRTSDKEGNAKGRKASASEVKRFGSEQQGSRIMQLPNISSGLRADSEQPPSSGAYSMADTTCSPFSVTAGMAHAPSSEGTIGSPSIRSPSLTTIHSGQMSTPSSHSQFALSQSHRPSSLCDHRGQMAAAAAAAASSHQDVRQADMDVRLAGLMQDFFPGHVGHHEWPNTYGAAHSAAHSGPHSATRTGHTGQHAAFGGTYAGDAFLSVSGHAATGFRDELATMPPQFSRDCYGGDIGDHVQGRMMMHPHGNDRMSQ